MTERRRSLGQRDIVLYTVSAILLLETLSAAASIGAAAIFWWLFLGVAFLIPFALICAEMGCTYPQQGGIYAWIRDAFGGRWGARASWCYWINTAVWLPVRDVDLALMPLSSANGPNECPDTSSGLHTNRERKAPAGATRMPVAVL